MKSQIMGGLCALLCLTTVTSEAASIFQTPTELTGSQDSFVFSGFDSSLGTLTSVSLSWDVSAKTDFVCTSFDCNVSSSVDITGDGPLAGLNRQDSDTSGVVWNDFLGPVTGRSFFKSSQFFSTAVGFDSFIDATDFSIFFQLSPLLLNGTATDHTGNPISSTFDPDESNSAQLRYVFNSNAVPIPAAVWLFSSGLLGLFGVARRRR